ncbi:LLM class flavin-dependent oxidoreductase [Arthrobacter sp. ATA002]|uniref:LLM class flavin-dependent oxidoreductase n=1 Tax=Arthrobacter sp. ATA002 TaxID=2991715 RepID=UPI0022A69A5A|nr:LLM class flavin-dependent oxidoreductase [Arthrobacter sp. ATA002]WAP52443.1 LLM class flavin-dependent oxidoreductase [Arthrobacter sp. ATA002]
MPDYGRNLLFGSFITPAASPPQHAVELTVAAESLGLDLATFQDHPYQPRFLDTWTLLSYAAARTERITLATNVLNLPLRQPVIVARSAASLDLLSGGRFELGLGAGAFWDAIVAVGGERLEPGDAVTGLAEAIDIIRGVWAADERTPLRVDGKIHRVNGAKRGPAPAHDAGIWLGAYKPRMLRLTGATADGWVPTLGYLPGGPAELAAMNGMIDEAASAAGRDPAVVRRMLNISGTFSATGSGLLNGPPDQWARELAEMTLEYGISGFLLATDSGEDLARFGRDVAPQVRELVAAARAGTPEAGPA